MLPSVDIAGQPLWLYNLCVGAGIAFALWTFAEGDSGVPRRERPAVLGCLGVSIAAGFVCARLGDALGRPRFEFAGGMAVMWGVLGGTACFLLCRRLTARRAALMMELDALALSLAAGMLIGRLGCIFGGCCFGRPTGLSVGMIYPLGASARELYGTAPLWPAPLIDMAALWLIAAAMTTRPVRCFGRAKFFVAAYSVCRFLTELIRGNDRGEGALGLSPAQTLCAVCLAAVGVEFLYGRMRADRGHKEPASSSAAQNGTFFHVLSDGKLKTTGGAAADWEANKRKTALDIVRMSDCK